MGVELCFQETMHTPVHSWQAKLLSKPVIGRVQQYTSPWPFEFDESNSTVHNGGNILVKPLQAAVHEGLCGAS